MSIAQTSKGIQWYEEQSGPRMLTVSYNAIHTPYQQAPQSLAPPLPPVGGLTCGNFVANRLISNNSFEAMDSEIGRLLSSLDLASLDDEGVIRTFVDGDGNLQIPELQASNTMVVIVGDNGSFGPSVKSTTTRKAGGLMKAPRRGLHRAEGG